jgi:3',5'-cyclic-AMP phosphodiesterase
MTDKGQDLIDQNLQDSNNDGVDRHGFLKCMAWAGTGLVWTLGGGVPMSRALSKGHGKNADKSGDFSFVQISDSHIGFNKPAHQDVTATLQKAIDKINAMPHKPDFIIHTGDLSQLSKPSEFDTLDQVLRGASAKHIYFVPGEHDMLTDNGEQYLQRCGKGTKGAEWYSFDHKGVHFVGLVNVANLKAGGMEHSVTNSCSGWRMISRVAPPAPRLCSLRIFHRGPFIRIEVGEPTTASKRCLSPSVLAP